MKTTFKGLGSERFMLSLAGALMLGASALAFAYVSTSDKPQPASLNIPVDQTPVPRNGLSG